MRRIMRELDASGHGHVSPYNIARIYGAIDDKQRELESFGPTRNSAS
jgi:hypothetical protein